MSLDKLVKNSPIDIFKNQEIDELGNVNDEMVYTHIYALIHLKNFS